LPRHSRPGRKRFSFLSGSLVSLPLALSGFSGTALSQAGGPSPAELAGLSIEELASVQITTVSRRPQAVADTPAALFVITAEDIRRSGALTLPEALRLAPNLHVARLTSSRYAISARGQNATVANKLLVMIDGRSVYTPLFSGVFWSVQDLMLDDVERIEVLSGPGAAQWGSNAVNGVINVITRNAADTQGTLVSGIAGNRAQGGAVRHGGTLGDNGHYRVFGKFLQHQAATLNDGSRAEDAWDRGQIGFRADWSEPGNTLTVHGSAYQGESEQEEPGLRETSGANLLLKWNRQLEGGSDLRVQAYYDRTERDQEGVFGQTLDILDLEVIQALPAQGRHAIVWGGGYRFAHDRIDNSEMLAFLPARRNLRWSNLFVQDEITLTDPLRLTLGARLEHNDYTGLEFLPNARLAWAFLPDHLLWTSIARAVRSPSRIDREFFRPGQPPYTLAGGADFRSEVSNVVEFGYRAESKARWSYAITLFYHDHQHLRSREPTTPEGPLVLGNEVEGNTRGVELWSSYRITPGWQLSGGYTYLQQRLRISPGGGDPEGVRIQGNDPRHNAQLHSRWTLSPQWELDLSLRHVSALPDPQVPSYTEVDARVAWMPNDNLEISLVGQNLAGDRHVEFGNVETRSEFGRAVYLGLKWNLR